MRKCTDCQKIKDHKFFARVGMNLCLDCLLLRLEKIKKTTSAQWLKQEIYRLSGINAELLEACVENCKEWERRSQTGVPQSKSYMLARKAIQKSEKEYLDKKK